MIDINNPWTRVILAWRYLQLWVCDMLEYLHQAVVLALPASIFGQPLIAIEAVADSDSESDSDHSVPASEVFISRLQLDNRRLNGLQLLPFLDKRGHFFVSHIQRHVPQLKTIYLDYLKLSDNRATNVSREIDVAQCRDLLSGKSCRMGVVL